MTTKEKRQVFDEALVDEPQTTAVTSMPEKPVEVMGEEEIMHWLRSHSTPTAMIDAREGRGGQSFYYLRHQYVTETLNRITGFDWDFRILRERLDEDNITVYGELTVRVGDRVIVKGQYGSAEVERYSSGKNAGKPLSTGDAFKMAASDALKKCASQIGLGLDLSTPIREGTMKALHATGTAAFGSKWDDARPQIIRTLTGGKKTSSKDLMDAEARVLISVLKGDKSSDLLQQTAEKLRPVARRFLTNN